MASNAPTRLIPDLADSGLPNAGLLPSKREWAQQEEMVQRATAWLEGRGVTVSGEVVGTRKGAERICEVAAAMGASAIVMGADPDWSRLIGDFLWSQEPQRVRRRAKITVHLIVSENGTSRLTRLLDS